MRIRPAHINGKRGWCLDARNIGQGRKFFPSKSLAETEMDTLTEQVKINGHAWMELSPSERVELLSITEEIKTAGLTLRAVWESYKSTKRPSARALEKAIEDIIIAKRAAGRREVYVSALERTLNTFAKGRGQTPVAQISTQDIEQWLASRHIAPQTHQSEQSRIATLFEFCLRKGYVQSNPCRGLESISIDIEAPRILTVDQCNSALQWTTENKPHMLAWLILTMITGLRPRGEADVIGWDSLELSYKRIHIKAAETKVRTHRFIDLTLFPNAQKWLAFAKGKSSVLPVSYITRRRYIRKLAKHLGFDGWPQDILRHTAASYLFALHQDAGKVAAQLGNSASVLLRRYRALVVREEAEKFHALNPPRQ